MLFTLNLVPSFRNLNLLRVNRMFRRAMSPFTPFHRYRPEAVNETAVFSGSVIPCIQNFRSDLNGAAAIEISVPLLLFFKKRTVAKHYTGSSPVN